MYLFLYLNLLRKREFEDSQVVPARLLKKVLEEPISNLISEIQSEVNNISVCAFLESKGIDSDFRKKKTQKIKRK